MGRERVTVNMKSHYSHIEERTCKFNITLLLVIPHHLAATPKRDNANRASVLRQDVAESENMRLGLRHRSHKE